MHPSAQTLVVLVTLAAVALYAIFGGADFGGGVWDVLASGPRKPAQRAAIAHAIGPVWETNHVWLIFLIVALFTCFPPAFAALSTGLFAPLTFVLVGIILRGAAFAFRSRANEANARSRSAPWWGRIFGAASLITPFFFGTAVGGLTVGAYAWTAPFALVTGLFAVALCAQLAAVLLTLETRGALQTDFRARALAATIVLAALGAVALGAAYASAPATFADLVQPRALRGIGVAMALGLALLAALLARAYVVARVVVALETVAILAGWYLAQSPFLIPGVLRVDAAIAPLPTLRAFLWLTLAGSIVLVPSLLLLFAVFKRGDDEVTTAS